ncbi:MAG: hypothetical protein MUC97_09245 [Bernardetiaceae bacterium]|jgi:hypothetical protein|nr:hypothetical protein [Bernardetiaceae bacterium]
MEPLALPTLQAQFEAQAGLSFTQNEFAALLLYFPVLLVVEADGELQSEEWQYLGHLAKALADSFKDGLPQPEARTALQERYLHALRYLRTHLREWDVLWIRHLHTYLALHPELKEEAEEILYLFAEANHQTSEAEGLVIAQLKTELGL